MEKIIQAINLKKTYDNFTAVKNISFDVTKGEFFGFLGPNGAGKTTTINMLIGMAKITDGKIFYKGEDLTKNIKKAQKMLGIVSDSSNLYDEMTGFDNLCFCGSLYGLSRKTREKRADDLLGLFQLKEAGSRKFKAYSKGMKRKLTIAAAIIHEPEILFLDEPTSGIDVASARQIRNLLKQLNHNGTTVFMTTHYIEEAERLCDRIAFIKQGEIIKIDSMTNLLEDSKETNIVEITFEITQFDRNSFLTIVQNKFPDFEIEFKNENTLKVISKNKINIAPIVHSLSNEKVFILEAKINKPTLEDVFVKLTGIDIDVMKKEKEKK